MTVALTGTGGIFTRWGAEIAGINELNTYRGAALDTRIGDVRAQYLATDQDLLDGLQANATTWRGNNSWAINLQSIVTATLTRMARDDGWDGIYPGSAIKYLIAQMVTSVDSIKKPTVTATPSTGTNVGTGVIRTSTLSPWDGLAKDYPLAETIGINCTGQGYPGGTATPGQEPFQLRGSPSVDPLAWNWPQGSGASLQIAAVSPNSSGVAVADGGFENWNINTPTNWVLAVGVAGTDIFKASSSGVGTGSLQFTGDGTILHKIYQVVTLQPNTAYAFNVLMKRSSTPSTASIRFRLTDSAYTTIVDANSANNLISQALSGATTSWASYGGYFRTPKILPSEVRMVIEFTIALPAAETCTIDNLCPVTADEAYAGGPYVKIFAGTTNFAVGDSFSIAVANSLGVTSFGRSLDRLLGLRSQGVRIPSLASSNTIDDALIA